MQELDVIKNACVQAINNGIERSDSIDQFYRVADPESVLELIRLAEERITPHELETLTILIRNLMNHLEASKEEGASAALPDREDLIRQAKYILSLYAR